MGEARVYFRVAILGSEAYQLVLGFLLLLHHLRVSTLSFSPYFVLGLWFPFPSTNFFVLIGKFRVSPRGFWVLLFVSYGHGRVSGVTLFFFV